MEWATPAEAIDRIIENLYVFQPAAAAAYAEQGRGALVVDTTVRPTGAGHPFTYVPQTMFEEGDDEDIRRMVREYNPDEVLVLLMIQPYLRRSTYRVNPTLLDSSLSRKG